MQQEKGISAGQILEVSHSGEKTFQVQILVKQILVKRILEERVRFVSYKLYPIRVWGISCLVH
ncbi:hypothetical protein BJP37_14285 [Moorena bouillonii PNG]|uniref:Uncharacterized protein n=1 Tax=Moorena bouillonii PNG TaxID=568701 RepID=A0A1U7N240_9CYAN|nr:hypothetical protein BJP37_14285 [Moorena bouillonii PNG]